MLPHYNRFKICVFVLGIASHSLVSPSSYAEIAPVIHKGRAHLRSGTEPEWDIFSRKKPKGQKLELHFHALANETEQSLFIEQNDVKLDWIVRLNGTNIGKLFLMEAPLVWSMPIPPHKLVTGENVLTISPPKENDDIIVGPITIDPRPLRDALGTAALKVAVRENGKPAPCRITITRTDGYLAALQAETGQRLAVRPGVAYTADGNANLLLLPGSYLVSASRGPEYSLAQRKIKLRPADHANVSLEITRELPTPGFASCDTHVHTWTYSKHGDATLDERMLTIAGEALELPIATDHNVIIDYSSCARSNNVAEYFTPIIGDEVTTAKGHFNAFPIRFGSVPPDFKQEHWPTLMELIRATPGVQAVVLNHPTDTHTAFCPFASTNFNRVTGQNLRGFQFSFDAVELVNSGALRSDLMETFHCWFALLNYGYRVTGVGASDSHDVSRFIVGQGRTYIRCDDHHPGAINIDEAVRNLRAGRALVSLGLITNMRVDEKFGVGDLATDLGSLIRVTVDILGPRWSNADRVELFANGTRIREQRLHRGSRVEKGHITWTLPRPAHDVYLVAVATGPGITSQHWAIPRPYQPTSTHWDSRVLGATNPVWIDADGDGQFTAARQYAQQIVKRVGTAAADLVAALADYDEAVAEQCASLCQQSGEEIDGPEFSKMLRAAAPSVQSGFSKYLHSLSNLKIPASN